MINPSAPNTAIKVVLSFAELTSPGDQVQVITQPVPYPSTSGCFFCFFLFWRKVGKILSLKDSFQGLPTYVSIHGNIEQGIPAKENIRLAQPNISEEVQLFFTPSLYFLSKKSHLASQAGKMQIRIIRVPEMMWPKNGTSMIGFLPESENTLKIEITCSSVYLVQSLFYLKVGRDTEKPI